MLGEKLGEFKGRVTGTRILPGDDYRYVKMEVSIEEQGSILGVPVTDVATFVSYARSGGQMYAEGQGIMISAEGESAIWNGHAVGHPTGDGMAISLRFSIAFQAGEGKLSALNDYLVIGEFESAADGTIKTSAWAWQ
ncbi:MAG: hypothetical protein AB7T37_04195 [Dehalococcoidia bacterium]